MLSQCKYSCWEWYDYRSKAKKFEGAAIDRSMDCYGWANNGECGKNPVRAAACVPIHAYPTVHLVQIG